MNLNYLKHYCQEKANEYPILKEDFADFYYLANYEIQEGGSEMHETSLAIQSIDEAIEDYIEKIKDLELQLKQLKGEL